MYNQHVARHDRSLQFDLANMQIESIRRATHYISFVTHCRGAGGGPPVCSGSSPSVNLG